MIWSKVVSREVLFAEQIITIDFSEILRDEREKNEKYAYTAAYKIERSRFFMKSANVLRRIRAFVKLIKYIRVCGHSSGMSNNFTNVITRALVIVNNY